MKKLLFLLFIFSLLLTCLSLGQIARAEATLNIGEDCGDDKGACQDATKAPYNDPAKYNCQSLGLCEGADTKCCKALTACAKPNTCVLASICSAPEDKVGATCPDPAWPTCCKPVCTNCKTIAECSGPNLEIDTSMRKCTEAGKVCCKTKSSGGTSTPGGTGGEVIPGDSIDLEQYSPVVASIPELIGLIIKGVLGIVGSIALLMFIYGGFLMLTSQGDPGKIKKGKDALIWASAGLVVIFGSYIFVNYIILGLTGAGK